jgi:hypothetical protein
MKQAFAFDRSVRSVDADGRLRVATSPITKATVNPYYGREIPDYEQLGLQPERIYYLLRDAKELQKAVSSFNNLPILIKHQPVSADDHPKQLVVGTTGSHAAWHAPYIEVDLTIWDATAIAGIESKEQTELSSAYRYTADMTPGVYQGMRYDGVMRDIQGNHVALVDVGRAGRDVVVQDSAGGLPLHLQQKQAAYCSSEQQHNNNLFNKNNEEYVMSDVNTQQSPALASAQAALQKLAPQLDSNAIQQVLSQLLADSCHDMGQDEDDDYYPLPEDEEAEDAEGSNIPDTNKQAQELHALRQQKKNLNNSYNEYLASKADSVMTINGTAESRAARMFLKKRKQEREEQEKLKGGNTSTKQGFSNNSIAGDAMLVAEQRAVKRIEALYQARDAVKPLVGHVALDSAESVYRFALEQSGISTRGVHPSAYRAMTHMLLKQHVQQHPALGMDASLGTSVSQSLNQSLNKQHPQLGRFKQA